MKVIMWIALPLCALLTVASGIEIKANIPSSLRECYNDSIISTRENLLPFTVTTLISLVRKLEDSVTTDMRVLTSAILHRFRFDGIQRFGPITWSEDVIPFSPTGSEFHVYKVLFEKLVPITQPIPNNTLTYIERCTLHAMLSLTVDPADRGDDSVACSKISKYSSSNSWDWGGNRLRFPRHVSKLNDAEVFDPKVGPSALDEDTHRFPNSDGAQSGNFQQYLTTTQESQCPLESGVVYDKYGAVSAGMVLAGVATGLQQENVNFLNLMNTAGSSWLKRPQTAGRPSYDRPPYDRPSYDRPSFDRPSFDRPGQRVNFGSKYDTSGGWGGSSMMIDNRHASTFAGVLAKTSLILGPTIDMQKITMSGGWNDTSIPKYYFVRDYTKDALTEPSLRGSIDGLLLAKEVKRWSDSTSGSLKLSQVLGMYYSEKGLFGTNVKACTRRDHLSEIGPDSEIKEQASKFAAVLRSEIPSVVTLEGIQRYVSTVTDEAMHYISNSMTETCPPTTRAGTSYSQSPAVDLHVVIDTNYDYKDISKIITYIVDNMEINKYSSNFSLINGYDGSIIIESAQSPLDVYRNFTFSTYNSLRKGFDFDKLLTVIRERFRDSLRYDALTSSGGGDSRVVLFIPQASANVNNKDSLLEKVKSLRVKVPDVKLLYLLLSGSKDKFSSFADEADKDIFTVTVFNDVGQSLNPVIQRIAAVPKRIINPRCGPAWSSSTWYSTATVKGFLEQPEVQYYRIHPNYFYKDTNAKVTVRNEDRSQTITVCTSRKLEQPIANNTRSGSYTAQNCKTLSGGQENVLSVSSSDCPGTYASSCDPHYISVSTGQTTVNQLSNIVSCMDADCKYPDLIKYTVSHQGLGCYSGVGRILGAPIFVSLFIIINFLR